MMLYYPAQNPNNPIQNPDAKIPKEVAGFDEIYFLSGERRNYEKTAEERMMGIVRILREHSTTQSTNPFFAIRTATGMYVGINSGELRNPHRVREKIWGEGLRPIYT